MAAGQEVLIQDLPGELFEQRLRRVLRKCNRTAGRRFLRVGRQSAAFRSSKSAFRSAAKLERTLLTTALRHTQGHKQERRGYSAGAATP